MVSLVALVPVLYPHSTCVETDCRIDAVTSCHMVTCHIHKVHGHRGCDDQISAAVLSVGHA